MRVAARLAGKRVRCARCSTVSVIAGPQPATRRVAERADQRSTVTIGYACAACPFHTRLPALAIGRAVRCPRCATVGIVTAPSDRPDARAAAMVMRREAAAAATDAFETAEWLDAFSRADGVEPKAVTRTIRRAADSSSALTEEMPTPAIAPTHAPAERRARAAAAGWFSATTSEFPVTSGVPAGHDDATPPRPPIRRRRRRRR